MTPANPNPPPPNPPRGPGVPTPPPNWPQWMPGGAFYGAPPAPPPPSGNAPPPQPVPGGPSPLSQQLTAVVGLLGSINTGIGLANQKLGVVATNSAPPAAAPPAPPQPPGGSFSWFKLFNQIASGAGNAGSAIAGNRFAGPLTSALKKAPSVKALGLAGRFAGAAGVLIDATVKLTDAFNQRAKELMPFSPAIAQANAENTLKTMLADMREADAMGGTYARISTASNDIWIEIRDLLLPIKETIGGVLGDVLELMRDVLTFLKPFLQVLMEVVKGGFIMLYKAITFRFLGALEEFHNTVKRIEEALSKKDKAPFDPWKDLEKSIPRLPDVGMGPAAGAAGLNVPGLVL